jgi:3-oxo-5-alpha-steroid 4-dehydrogenase 3
MRVVALQSTDMTATPQNTGALLDDVLTLPGIRATLATPRTTLGLALHVAGHVQQHRAHAHLAGLRKYTLPHAGWFARVVCAHYSAECLVYLGLAVVAAPPTGALAVNGTLAAAAAFVAVNLGVTGKGTMAWYREKFGEDAVRGKWIMVPGVY